MRPGIEKVPEEGRVANATALLIFAETGDQVRRTFEEFGLVLVAKERLEQVLLAEKVAVRVVAHIEACAQCYECFNENHQLAALDAYRAARRP